MSAMVRLIAPAGASDAPVSHGDRAYFVHADQTVWVPSEAVPHLCRSGGFVVHRNQLPEPLTVREIAPALGSVEYAAAFSKS
jgi:hypothetical protein